MTGAGGRLGNAVVAALDRAGYDVRATGPASSEAGGRTGAGLRQGELTDPDFVAGLFEGVSRLVHLEPLTLVQAAPDASRSPVPASSPGELLDAAARGTHVVMKAALAAGVRHVVQASTLAVMDAYDENLEVTEQWRPRPGPVPEHLAPYLAELSAREFTRDVQLDEWLSVVCLRFERLGETTGERTLRYEDAAGAVVRALALLDESGGRFRGHRWHVLHVAPAVPTARYTGAAAAQALGIDRESA